MAHTIVIGSSPQKKVTGRKADVVLAAHYASQAALRLLQPGTEVSYIYLCTYELLKLFVTFFMFTIFFLFTDLHDNRNSRKDL